MHFRTDNPIYDGKSGDSSLIAGLIRITFVWLWPATTKNFYNPSIIN